MNDLVSVIVLSYKNIDGIYETLDSILNQDYENIEIIISDDGTPNFQEELKLTEYIKVNNKGNITNVVMNVLKNNVGTVKNINSAIGKSSGRYIKLLSAEDCLNSSKALKMYVAFMQENSFKIVFAKMRGVTLEGEYKYELASCESNYQMLKKYTTEQTLNRLFKRDFLPAPASFIDRELFEEYGLFREDTRLIEDYPYWIYLTMNKVKFGYLDEILIDYKMSGSGAGNYSEVFMRDMFTIYEKYIFPYDTQYGSLQQIYNALKRAGLNFYVSKAKWNKMSKREKIIVGIKYFPFYMLIELQNINMNRKNKKRRKEEIVDEDKNY